MSGGAGKGDIASFATDVAGGKGSRRLGLAAQAPRLRRRPRQALRLREHRRLGLPRHPDRQPAGQRDRRRPRRRPRSIGGGGPDTIDGGQGSDGCKGAKGRHRLLRQGKGAERRPPTSSSTRRRAAAPACRSSAAAVATTSSSPSTRPPRPSASPRAKALAIGPGCIAPPSSRHARSPARADGPGRWLMADLGPGNDSAAGRRLAGRGRQRPPRRRPRQRHDQRRPRGRPDRGRPRRRQALRRRRRRRPGRRPARPDLPLRRRQRRPAGGRRRLRRRRDRRRPRPRRRLLRRDPGPSRPADHLLPQARRLGRRDQGLRLGPPRPAPTRTWRAPSTGTS